MPKGLLGLEIASTQVRFAYLEKNLRKITLLKSGAFAVANPDLINDPGFLSRTIQDILSKNRIFPSKIFLSLSGDHVMINQLNLPRMKKDEMEEVLRDEIKRTPRFASAPFDYVYAVSKISEQKSSVVVCALRQVTVDSVTRAVRKTGIPLESLEISPLNFLEFLYPEAPKEASEATVFLDDHASSLVITWQSGIRFFFQMSSGKKDFYTEAGQLDPSRFQVWWGEIKRVLKSYHRQFLARSVEKLWVVENGPSREDFLKTLGEVLEVHTASLTPEALGVTIGVPQAADTALYFLPMAGPLASYKGIRQKFNFEHFLKRVNVKDLIRRTTVYVALYCLVLAAFCAGLSLHFAAATRQIQAAGKTTQARLDLLTEQTSALKKERDDYMKTKMRLLKQASFIKTLNRASWSEILAKISAVVPSQISLSNFNISESMEVKIEGATFEIDKIADMIRKLSDVPILEMIKFNYFRETQMDKKRIVEFGITAQIKSP